MKRKQRKFASLREWADSYPSQGEAARVLGISESYLSMLLTGSRIPSRGKALEIAEKTHVPVEILLKIHAA